MITIGSYTIEISDEDREKIINKLKALARQTGREGLELQTDVWWNNEFEVFMLRLNVYSLWKNEVKLNGTSDADLNDGFKRIVPFGNLHFEDYTFHMTGYLMATGTSRVTLVKGVVPPTATTKMNAFFGIHSAVQNTGDWK